MKSMQSIALYLSVFAVVASSQATRKDEVTLVMVPRDDGPVRVGMDLANRYPTLLISYKLGANGTVSLHGWTGSEWVSISAQAFEEGNFFRTGPTSAVLVENEGQPVPESLIPAMAWCPSVYKIATMQTRPLLHLIGQYYDFNFKEWKWFAANYHLPIDSINPDGLNVAWYHKRLTEHLKSTVEVASSDLQYWQVVRRPEPVEMDKPIVVEEMEPSGEMEPSDIETSVDLQESPLTNAVPEAVVLGAGDAKESDNEDQPVE